MRKKSTEIGFLASRLKNTETADIMFSIRSILLIGAIWLLIYVIQRIRKSNRRPTQANVPEMQMVRCQHCGVYIPAAEAIRKENAIYCSDEHLQQDHSS